MRRVLLGLALLAAPTSGASQKTTSSLVRAFNAAFVRIVADKDWETIVSKYSKAFAASWTCSGAPNQYAFPSATSLTASDVLKDVLDSGKLRVLGFQANWGTDGDYTQNPVTGFWPDILEALVAKMRTEYSKPALAIERVYLPTSAKILTALKQGTGAPAANQAHMTEPYFFGSSLMDGDDGLKYFRHEKFTMSCTIGGAQHTVFTKTASTIKTQVALNAHLKAQAANSVKVGVLTEGNMNQYTPVINANAAWKYKSSVTVATKTAMDLFLPNLMSSNEVQTAFTHGTDAILAGWTLVSVLPSGASSAATPKTKAELTSSYAGYTYPITVTFDHFVDTAHLVNAVVSGQIVAGIASSTAAFYSNANLNAFDLNLVSPQAALFRMDDPPAQVSGASRAAAVARLGLAAALVALGRA